jgi:hypothetical protein
LLKWSKNSDILTDVLNCILNKILLLSVAYIFIPRDVYKNTQYNYTYNYACTKSVFFLYAAELGYNVMKGTEYFVSL